MEVTLERLANSIRKVSDLIDLNLDNLNQEFLVDNFKPHNNLKSTKLRKFIFVEIIKYVMSRLFSVQFSKIQRNCI